MCPKRNSGGHGHQSRASGRAGHKSSGFGQGRAPTFRAGIRVIGRPFMPYCIAHQIEKLSIFAILPKFFKAYFEKHNVAVTCASNTWTEHALVSLMFDFLIWRPAAHAVYKIFQSWKIDQVWFLISGESWLPSSSFNHFTSSQRSSGSLDTQTQRWRTVVTRNPIHFVWEWHFALWSDSKRSRTRSPDIPNGPRWWDP